MIDPPRAKPPEPASSRTDDAEPAGADAAADAGERDEPGSEPAADSPEPATATAIDGDDGGDGSPQPRPDEGGEQHDAEGDQQAGGEDDGAGQGASSDAESPEPVASETDGGAAHPSDAPSVEAAPVEADITLNDAVADGDSKSGGRSDDVVQADAGDGQETEPAAPGPIEVTFFGRTDVGQIREHNEDNFLVADLSTKLRGMAGAAKQSTLAPAGLLLAVCDGMGGAAAGEVASQLATDVIYERLLNRAGHETREQLAMDIIEALEVAGAAILREATENRACRGMGTTATVAALVDDHLLLGQVGDSRGYILRGDRLVQVTRDQSLVNQLVEAGQLTEEEAENFEHSNIILQALGTAEAVQVDLTYVHLRRGDVLLLCSDGLSGMIRDTEIAETLTNVPDLVQACRVLIDDANEAGGHDNITVVMALFDGEGLAEPTLDDVESLKYEKFAVSAAIASARGAGGAMAASGEADEYDSTPSIEITGEFEVAPNTSWQDVLDDRPDIPKESGPAMSSMLTWLLIIALLLALYFLLFAR